MILIDNRHLFDKQHRLKEEFVDQLYQINYVTMFLCIFPVLIPSFSVWYFALYLLLIITCFVWKKTGIKYRLHHSARWRMGSVIIHLDVCTFFIGLALWRSSGQNLLIGGLELVFIMISIGIGHCFRRRIASELRNPKTGWGRMLPLIGSIGAGKGALLGYLISGMAPLSWAPFMMYILMLIVVIIMYALWNYVEEPINNLEE
jgi:hypothetical protein